MPPLPLFVGIDVAQDTLDVAIRPTTETWTVRNDEAGITALVTQRQTVAPILVVFEATGGFQGAVTAALAAAGLPVVVVHPRHVRALARAVGILANMARLDARVLAHVAEAAHPIPRPLPHAETQDPRALLGRRRQRLARRTAERHRLASAPPVGRDTIQQPSTWLEAQRHALDAAMTQRLQARAVWSMGALVATKHNPVSKAFYARWCAAGTARKVALTACMHTLLTLMNAMVRTLTP